MIYLVTTSIKRFELFKQKFPEQEIQPFIVDGPIETFKAGRGLQFILDKKVFSLTENKNLLREWDLYVEEAWSALSPNINIVNIMF